MKESITNIILEILETNVAGVIDTAWIMSTTKSESYRRLRKLLYNREVQTVGKKFVADFKADNKEYRKYRVLLSRLHKQGLIMHEGNARSGEWTITKLGISKLTKSKSDPRNVLLTEKPGLTIVSYDVPEGLRRQRDRLREVLKIADFEQVHKSLWYSKKKVTMEFLKILKGLNVLGYVHIFEVNKQGSLNPLAKDIV